MSNTAKLLFSGDFVYSKDVIENDFEISSDFSNIIKNHDIFCCNLEGPIINENCRQIKKIGPNIYNSESSVKKLNKAGANLFCLANNHILDYGQNGLSNTLEFLDKEKIQHIGAGLNKQQTYSPYYIRINNIKIAFINIAENGFGAAIEKDYGYAYAFHNEFKRVLAEAKEKSDFVIVISHMGAEHWEIPLIEVREFYKSLIDDGASAIIAHHPHVPQGWEEYKNCPIFYSLGNFIFDKGKGIQNPKAYSVSLILEKNSKIHYSIIPTTFENYFLKTDNCDYSNLANILKNSDEYDKIFRDRILKSYEKYKNAYYKAVSYDRGNIKEILKGFIKRNIFRKRFSDIWLYHNLNIETHLWICKRATRIKIEENMEKNK